MRRQIILVLLLFISVYLFGQYEKEQLEFDLYFGFVKGGKALFVSDDASGADDSLWHVKMQGYTVGIANALYRVDNTYESYLKKDNFLPVKAIKDLKEKNYHFYNEVTFNQQVDSAYSQRSGAQKIEAGICDMVSLVYYLRFSNRLNGMAIGHIFEIPFWDNDRWYPLKMSYKGLETVKTRWGEKECMHIEPIIDTGKLFKGNPINVWFTNDEQRLPVLMELNFKVGTVKCKLIEKG
jgi:hypothetical protein